MPKGLVFGNGFLGSRIAAELGYQLIGREEVNPLNFNDLGVFLDSKRPDVAINAVGKTGGPGEIGVDWCETHREESFRSNVSAAINISSACSDREIYFVHFGSGCIYEGDNGGRGFKEEDEPNFSGSYYSRTKMAIEKILKEFNVLQIRIRMPINGETNERNLITKLLRYDKIINVPNSLTYVDDLMVAGEKLMQLNATGIFNVVNPQPATHKQILDSHNLVSPAKKEYSLITLSELDKMTAARRSNCVLSTKKLNSLGIHLTPTQEAIKKSVAGYVEAENGK